MTTRITAAKETIPAADLDHLLAKFFKDIRKINGNAYEPDTLLDLQQTIQRFLEFPKAYLLATFLLIRNLSRPVKF